MLIQLTVWKDPLADASWLDCSSDDALWYLTPSLGPSSTLVLHHVTQWLNASAGLVCTYDLEALSAMFGLTPSTFLHTMKRLEAFGCARRIVDSDERQCWEVRTVMPPLSRRFARRIPLTLLETCPYLGFVLQEGDTLDHTR